MATTVEPTYTFSTEPMATGVSSLAASSPTFSTARSREESVPTTSASTLSPLGIRI